MAINALNNQLEAQFSTDFTLTSSNLASSILVLIDILVTQENPEKLKQNTFFQSIFQRVTFLSSKRSRKLSKKNLTLWGSFGFKNYQMNLSKVWEVFKLVFHKFLQTFKIFHSVFQFLSKRVFDKLLFENSTRRYIFSQLLTSFKMKNRLG